MDFEEKKNKLLDQLNKATGINFDITDSSLSDEETINKLKELVVHFNVIDSKKLRPTVVCRGKYKDDDMVIMTSEVCGANEILPNRDISKDIYTNERELVVVDNDLNIQRISQ